MSYLWILVLGSLIAMQGGRVEASEDDGADAEELPPTEEPEQTPDAPQDDGDENTENNEEEADTMDSPAEETEAPAEADTTASSAEETEAPAADDTVDPTPSEDEEEAVTDPPVVPTDAETEAPETDNTTEEPELTTEEVVPNEAEGPAEDETTEEKPDDSDGEELDLSQALDALETHSEPDQITDEAQDEINFGDAIGNNDGVGKARSAGAMAGPSGIRIRNNERAIADKMAHTFAYRRQEVVNQEPSIKDFKERWPALFQPKEINAEFQRLMAINFEDKFMAQLDMHSSELIKVLRAKGGATRQKATDIMDNLDKTDNIHVRRECVLKALIIFLRENADDLIKEYTDSEYAQRDLEQLTMAVFAIRREGEGLQEPPEDVGIVIEGVEVLHELSSVTSACALLLGDGDSKGSGSGTVAGVVGAIGVAIIGAVTGYFAHLKKKLCFKPQARDPESAKEENGAQSDPQVLSNLLNSS